MEFYAETAEFIREGEAFFAPLFKVWRAGNGVCSAREKDVGDFEVADGAAEAGGSGVEFSAQKQRGFAGFVGGAGIAENSGEGAAFVDDDGVVADLRDKRPGVVAHDETGQDDEGVGGGDEKTPLREVVNAALGEVNARFDFRHAGGLEIGLGQFGLEIGEFFFLDRQEGIHAAGALRPAVARLGKEEGRGAVHLHISVAVGAVGVHIHVGDDKERAAAGGGIRNLKHRLAIVEIVAREDGVEVRLAAADIAGFEFVEFVKEGRNPGVGQQVGQRGQDLREIGLVGNNVLKRARRARQTKAERDFDLVGIDIAPVDRGKRVAGFRHHGGFQRESVE